MPPGTEPLIEDAQQEECCQSAKDTHFPIVDRKHAGLQSRPPDTHERGAHMCDLGLGPLPGGVASQRTLNG